MSLKDEIIKWAKGRGNRLETEWRRKQRVIEASEYSPTMMRLKEKKWASDRRREEAERARQLNARDRLRGRTDV